MNGSPEKMFIFFTVFSINISIKKQKHLFLEIKRLSNTTSDVMIKVRLMHTTLVTFLMMLLSMSEIAKNLNLIRDNVFEFCWITDYPMFEYNEIDKKIDFSQIPICVEANTSQNLEVLKQLALSISSNLKEFDSEQRQQIHLAAAFACNFVNQLYAIGQELLEEKGIGFDILRPLILETANKIMTQTPKSAQTGPAIRNDQIIMEKHLEMLTAHPDLKKIYAQISQQIIHTHK